MGDVVHLFIELQEASLVASLRDQLRESEIALKELQRRYTDLEVLYSREVLLNSELVDLCRAHGVNFRPALSHSYRDKLYGR